MPFYKTNKIWILKYSKSATGLSLLSTCQFQQVSFLYAGNFWVVKLF